MFSPCSPGIVNITLDVCKKTCEITCPCSRDTGHARRSSRSRKIRPDRPSHRWISGLSDLTRPIDLSRARRRTHDTSRTTRHARHDHGTGTGQRVRIPRGESQSDNFLSVVLNDLHATWLQTSSLRLRDLP